MIDIDEVNKLEDAALEKRVDEERKTQKRNNDYFEENRRKNIAAAERGKEAAEKKFPTVLQRLEEDIKQAIQFKNRSVSMYCGGETEWETLSLQIMLCTVLPLQGFICRIKENKVEVSW